jgi:hypothetical protein
MRYWDGIERWNGWGGCSKRNNFNKTENPAACNANPDMTATQINNQINANYDQMEKLGQELSRGPGIIRSAVIEKELKRLWEGQKYWASEYKKATGSEMILVQGLQITGNLEEEKNEAIQSLAKQQRLKAAKAKLSEGIATVERERFRISTALQSQYDISVSFRNAMFSHWTRMGAGLHAKHPLIMKKQIDERVQPLLNEARRLMDAGKYEKAWAKVSAAAAQVKWGFDFLDWWMNQLEKGAKNAEAGIKVSAALATLVVAAPLELGIVAGMGVAAVGEGATQGTLLIAKGVDGKETITPEDVKKAVLETMIAGGTAGLGSGAGKLVAAGLKGRIAREILKRNPTEEQIEFVAKRIEQYLAANSASILKKLTKLDSDPDWNWWYMAIAPMISPVAMEMTKEPDLNKLLKK